MNRKNFRSLVENSKITFQIQYPCGAPVLRKLLTKPGNFSTPVQHWWTAVGTHLKKIDTTVAPQLGAMLIGIFKNFSLFLTKKS